MIPFTLHTLFKNKVLWAWPGLFLLFVIFVFIWGDVSSAQNSYSFMITLGDVDLPSGMVLTQLLGFVVLFAIIGLPNHFAENLKSERASLLLSKPISRTELFFSDFAAMMTITFFYSVISVLILAVLTVFKAAIFPVQLFIALVLLLPLLMLTYYITIVVFLILTNSYLAGAILGYMFTGFSSVFLDSSRFLDMLGWDSGFAHTIVEIFSYIIPSSGGIQQLLQGIYHNGFSGFDGGLFAFVIASCLPFGLLGYYLFLNKEY